MEYEDFSSFESQATAELVAHQLVAEGVPARVQAVKLDKGLLTEYHVFVAKNLAHRARWVVANGSFSDAELEYLATGSLDEPET